MKDLLLDKVLKIEQDLPSKSDSIGLHTGDAGKAIFYSYLSSYLNTNKYDEHISAALSNVFDSLGKENLDPCYCTGLAGVLWTINHLKAKEMIELDLDLSEAYVMLKETALSYAKEGHLDFLHGADGIIYTLLGANAIDEASLNIWLEQMYTHAHKAQHGLVWKTKLTKESKNDIFNLSLSHGISSKIIILTEALKKFPANTAAREILEGSINYLLHTRNLSGENFYFPAYIDHNNPSGGRLAWCYGDLGNAIALWRAGKQLNNTFWKDEALNVMRLATLRRNLEKEFVFDAGFCHGTSGVAHFFNRFYLETGKPEFEEAAHFWLEKTLEFGNHTDGIGGFKRYVMQQKGVWVNEPGFLEGSIGIAMVMLGFLSVGTENITWDASFLMN